MNKFALAIYTEESAVLEEEIETLVAPGADGYLGVWAHHAPLLSALAPGRLEIRAGRGDARRYAVSGGFLEVAANRAVVLADALESPEAIDVERARRARDRALARLRERTPGTDIERARAALFRALNRLAVAEGTAG